MNDVENKDTDFLLMTVGEFVSSLLGDVENWNDVDWTTDKGGISHYLLSALDADAAMLQLLAMSPSLFERVNYPRSVPTQVFNDILAEYGHELGKFEDSAGDLGLCEVEAGKYILSAGSSERVSIDKLTSFVSQLSSAGEPPVETLNPPGL